MLKKHFGNKRPTQKKKDKSLVRLFVACGADQQIRVLKLYKKKTRS